MTELELKLGVPPEARASLVQALVARGARRQRLRAVYVDTAGGALAAAGLVLRLRHEGRGWVQTLKAPGDSPVQRLEHEVRLRRGEAAQVDPARHAGTPAGERLLQCLAQASGDALMRRYETDIRRLVCSVHDAAGGTFELAYDEGRVRAGSAEQGVAELEIEHLAGPAEGLFALAEACLRHGGLWLSTLTKSARGEALVAAAAGPAPPRWPLAAMPSAPDGATLLRHALQDCLAGVMAEASVLAEGRGDDETQHQLRVQLRRLRTVLRELGPLGAAPEPSWAPALAATFAALGARRDMRAVAEAVAPLLQGAGAPRLRWPAPQAQADAATLVRDTGFQVTLLQILARLHGASDDLPTLAPAATRAAVARRLEALHRRVARAARGFEALPVEAQHRARKRLKRLRYLAELVAPLWPAAPARRYLARLVPAQRALGLHNDVATAAAAFRAAAADDPPSWFGAGWLQAHGAVTARAAGRALRRVRRARPFWRG